MQMWRIGYAGGLYSGVQPVVSTGCRGGGSVTPESWTR